MIYAVILSAALLAGAAILSLVRAERGKSMLDRTVAFDVFTTTLVAAVALEAAWSRRTDTLVLLVVLSLVGFVGSVTIARFAAVEPETAARVLTREEVEAEREAEQARREALRAERVAEEHALAESHENADGADAVPAADDASPGAADPRPDEGGRL